jgi:predicted MFS family arabinose efflux permease
MRKGKEELMVNNVNEESISNSDAQPTGRSFRSQAAALFFGRMVIATSFRMMFPFLGVFARSLGVSLTTMSLALTVREFTGLLTPLLALISDWAGRKAGMLIGIALSILASALLIPWSSFAAFFVMIVLVNVGMNIFLPALYAYIGDQVPYQVRGRVFALIEASWATSVVLAVPLMGWLIKRFGWRMPFPVLAAAGLLTFLFIAFGIPSTPRPKVAGSIRSLWEGFRSLFASRVVLLVLVVCFASGALLENIIIVFGLWMEDSFSLQVAKLGVVASVLGIGDLIGALLCSFLSDRLGKERTIFLGLLMSGLAALILPWLGVHLWGALLGLFIFFMFGELTFTAVLVLVTEVVPLARATMSGIGLTAASAGFMLAAFISPRVYILGGIRPIAIISLGLSLLGIIALSRVKIKPQEG